jgi:hypothetical protein
VEVEETSTWALIGITAGDDWETNENIGLDRQRRGLFREMVIDLAFTIRWDFGALLAKWHLLGWQTGLKLVLLECSRRKGGGSYQHPNRRLRIFSNPAAQIESRYHSTDYKCLQIEERVPFQKVMP